MIGLLSVGDIVQAIPANLERHVIAVLGRVEGQRSHRIALAGHSSAQFAAGPREPKALVLAFWGVSPDILIVGPTANEVGKALGDAAFNSFRVLGHDLILLG
jgi:hypothetical protein